MKNFKNFVSLIALSFGIPWLVLIVIPVIQYQQLQPVAYDQDTDGVSGFYPPNLIHRQGQLVYIREGCVQCHSQMIRPPHLALDGWRKGWGEDQSARPKDPVRPNNLRDYLDEPYAMLGIQRIGPDLTNAGWRFENRADLHLHLFAPRANAAWSVCPSYSHLYRSRLRQGQGSAQALNLPETVQVKAGHEIVPTADAEALVDYLLSLRKTYPIPAALAQGAAQQ